VIRVARAGLLTTVQDAGRPGVQQHGIVRAGAMDAVAHGIANVLVGNEPGAAALEATLLGPTLEFDADALVAVGGADLDATLDDRAVPLWRPFLVAGGSVLVLGRARTGCRAYVAVAGGIDVPVVMGSRSTDLIACMGGHEGRALAAGDTLPIGEMSETGTLIRDRIRASPRDVRSAGRSLLPRYTNEPFVRVLRGPEHDRFTAASQLLMFKEPFQLTAQSNRMGLRLTGPALSLAGAYDLFSSPVAAGSVQVPPSGEPIVLMADHQTIGGYPRIANVITVDLPLLAQSPPGAFTRFREVDMAEAQSLYIARERDLGVFADSLRTYYS
jgi:antagonist of KipI